MIQIIGRRPKLHPDSWDFPIERLRCKQSLGRTESRIVDVVGLCFNDFYYFRAPQNRAAIPREEEGEGGSHGSTIAVPSQHVFGSAKLKVVANKQASHERSRVALDAMAYPSRCLLCCSLFAGLSVGRVESRKSNGSFPAVLHCLQ